MTMDTPVLVAGAGPTGLTAALELARMGVPVRIVDKLIAQPPVSAPVALQPRTLDLLGRRGLRLWTLPSSYAVSDAAVYANGRLLGRVELAADFGREPDLVMPRADFICSLREQLARHGVAVEHGTELVSVSQPSPDQPPEPDWPGVRAELRRQDGRTQHVTTPYLIAAHGSQPTPRGLPECTARSKRSGRGCVVANVWLDGDFPSHEFSVLLGKHGFLTALPLGSGRFWFLASDPESRTGSCSSPSAAEIQLIADACSPMPVRLAGLTFSARVPGGRRVQPRLRHGRVFFGGASGYPTRPTAAWRANSGVQDMINLCWKLAMVLRGAAVPDLLTTYAPERVEAVRLVRTGESAAHVLGSRSAGVHQLVTRVVPALLDARFVLGLCADLAGEVVPTYRASPLSTAPHGSGGVQPGDSVPDVEVLAGRIDADAADFRAASMRELVDPSRLTLLVATDTTSAIQPDWEELTGQWRDTVAAYAIAPRPAHPDDPGYVGAFGSGRGSVVVRPDGYVAFAGGPRALPELVTWLSRWFPAAPPTDPGCRRDLAATGK